MLTTSFDRSFIISDPKAAQEFATDIANPRKVKAAKRDYDADSKRGVELLRKHFGAK